MLSPSAVAAVRDAARAVLAGDDAPVFRLPADVTADAFVEATDRHRLLPFFSLNLDRLDLDDDLRATIAARGQRERMPALMMARELFRAVDALSDAGVRVLTFKGIALAQQAYGDFTARGSGDLDLLVSPDDLVTARTALVDAGWAPDPAYPEPGPSWAWRHMVRNSYELSLNGTGSAIDLHWALDPTRSALPDFDTLWTRRTAVHLAGRDVATLAAYDALRHSCSHAAKDDWAWLRSLLDIHELAGSEATWVDASVSPFTRAQSMSLGVATHHLGRPPMLPRSVVDAATRKAHRHLAVAEQRQAGGLDLATGRFPGYGLLLQGRRMGRGVGSLTDARRVVSATALPPSTLGGITAERTHTAIATALARRRRRAGARFTEWRPGRH